MRFRSLLVGDIRFQFKYGFYFIYAAFTVLYLCLLQLFPIEWRGAAAVLMVFTDPAAMGLYFMGAIVLFEKGERVLDSIAVSPVRPLEYVLSKLASIALISVVVGLLISLGGERLVNPAAFVTGVFLASCLFSAIALIIALHIVSLNQFVVATIPAEILVFLPAVAWQFGWKPSWLMLHPGVCVLSLCNGEQWLLSFLLLSVWVAAFVLLAIRTMTMKLRTVGGAKL
jgi:fluoroquinolone transport system permease protein